MAVSDIAASRVGSGSSRDAPVVEVDAALDHRERERSRRPGGQRLEEIGDGLWLRRPRSGLHDSMQEQRFSIGDEPVPPIDGKNVRKRGIEKDVIPRHDSGLERPRNGLRLIEILNPIDLQPQGEPQAGSSAKHRSPSGVARMARPAGTAMVPPVSRSR